MEDNDQQQNIPLLCRKKCGFYGSPNFDGLCSKCHRSAQAQLAMQQADCIAPAFEARLTMNTVRKSSEPAGTHPGPPRESRESPSPVPDQKSPSQPSDFLLDPRDCKLSTSLPSRSPPEVELEVDKEATKVELSSSLPNTVKEDNDDDDEKRDSAVPSKSPRCHLCRKRVGPAGGYSCRCGGIFCSLHRYSDSHNCSFDYRKAGQDDIRRSNPQILCSKLPKI